jgi:general secretion pathway protein B
MSYILDALRKSDQQRRRGVAPILLAVQAPAVAPKQPALLVYGLLAAALLGAGMAIGWLRPWQAEQAAPGRVELVAAKPFESTPRQAAPAPSEAAPQPKPQVPLQNATPPAQAAPAPVPAKPQPRATPKPDGTPRHADAAVPGKAAAPAPAQPAGAAADAARVPTVISMAELPLSVQQELPPMTISFHAYSGNSRDRLVGINNRMLREGDDVAPGLKLEQITPEGMILGYKGYSFRRGVK